MKRVVSISAKIFAVNLVLLAALPSAAGASEVAGVRQMMVPSMKRGADISVTIWYPAQGGGEPATLGDSDLFEGTPALRDAEIQSRKYPLVMLSHGAGLSGTADALGWIAGPLAARGFIVAAPTHPGNGGANRSARETMKLWMRPTDITAALSAVLRDRDLKDHIIEGETGVLGLSMGGNTALAIAGARLDPERLGAYCDTSSKNVSLCGWIKQSGVDLHSMDLSPAGWDNRDVRFKFAVAIDPAPIDVFATESFSDISIPVTLINLGRPSEIPETVDAKLAAHIIRNASYLSIEDASHYSMFAVCKPGMDDSAVLAKIGDPVCTDGHGRQREKIHQQLIDMVSRAFKRALGQPH